MVKMKKRREQIRNENVPLFLFSCVIEIGFTKIYYGTKV
jgi:hypothetical protein